MASCDVPPVILFGYKSSPFTNKVRLSLRLKGVPYKYVTVPSMMPRLFLRETFGLTYRKIPVCVIGDELYCDTSIIVEALEHFFPASAGYRSLYPPAADGRTYRPLIRGFASYWADRPLFRVTTGLIPGVVWRTSFGDDRAKLNGHKLDADKLEKKVPRNLSALDLQLSMLEELFSDMRGPWIFSTMAPSLADAALYYQLRWGRDIAAGRLIWNLTGGGTEDTHLTGTEGVFNDERYPGLCKWFAELEKYVVALPNVEEKVDQSEALSMLVRTKPSSRGENSAIPLLSTSAAPHTDLDGENGLLQGTKVAVAPDDTGRADPIVGTLLALTPEEIVIETVEQASIPMRFHFPRLGFTITAVKEEKL